MPWVVCIVFASASVLAQASPPVERLTRAYDIRFLTEILPEFSLAGERPPAPRLALGDLDLLRAAEEAESRGGIALMAYEESLVTPGLRVSPEMLVELIKTNVDPEAWHDERARLSYEKDGGFLAVVARARTQRAVEEWLEKALAEEARLAILDLRVMEGPMEAIWRLQKSAGGGARLPPDWLESEGGRKLRETFRAASVGLTRGRRRLRGYEERAFVEDVETVSGGGPVMGAMPDPVISSAGSGFSLEASLRPLHSPGFFSLDLTLERCESRFDRKAEILAPADIGPPILIPGAPGSTDPSALKEERTRIYLPFPLPVLNPVIENFLEGDYGDALILPAPGGMWYRADLALGRRHLEGESEKRATAQGEFELLRWRQEHLAATIAATFGKTLVLGCFSSRGAKGEGPENPGVPSFAALLRVRATTARGGASGGGAGAGEPELPLVLDAGLLLKPPPDFSLNDSEASPVGVLETPGGLPLLKPLLEPELLEASLREALPREERERVKIRRLGRLALIGGTPAQTAAIRARLEALARGAARLAQVELWQLSASAQEAERLGGAGALLDPAILEQMALPAVRYARAAGLSGLPLSLAATRMRHYVSDVEGVSGGTGSAVIEVSDPAIGAIGEGLRLNTLARLVPETDWVRLDLQAEAADPPVFQRRARARLSRDLEPRRPAEASGAAGAPGEKKPPQTPWLALELPEAAAERWRHVAAAPAGRAVLLRAVPDPAGAGRQRVLIAAARTFDLP